MVYIHKDGFYVHFPHLDIEPVNLADLPQDEIPVAILASEMRAVEVTQADIDWAEGVLENLYGDTS